MACERWRIRLSERFPFCVWGRANGFVPRRRQGDSARSAESAEAAGRGVAFTAEHVFAGWDRPCRVQDRTDAFRPLVPEIGATEPARTAPEAALPPV